MVPENQPVVGGRVAAAQELGKAGKGRGVGHVDLAEVGERVGAALPDEVAVAAGPGVSGRAVDLNDDVDIFGGADLLHFGDVDVRLVVHPVVRAHVHAHGPLGRGRR
jgi:hypothetical protein